MFLFKEPLVILEDVVALGGIFERVPAVLVSGAQIAQEVI